MGQITILIVDDHTLIRETWNFILNNDPRFKVVALAITGEEAMQMVERFRPDVVIMDISLPGMDGIEATESICKLYPETRIIGMSAHSQPSYAKQIMDKGAYGYVTKNSSREEMNTAIMEVNKGNQYLCEEIRNTMAEENLNKKVNEINIDPSVSNEKKIMTFLKKSAS
jgi:DNA-binding NarL/FixJ family response regulator